MRSHDRCVSCRFRVLIIWIVNFPFRSVVTFLIKPLILLWMAWSMIVFPMRFESPFSQGSVYTSMPLSLLRRGRRIRSI